MKNLQTIVFFGGAELLCSLIDEIKKKSRKFNIIVFTSKRHFQEKINFNGSLGNYLKKNKLNFYVRKKISISEIRSKVDIKKTLFVSVGAAWIFKKDLINLLKGRIYNIHGTKLPLDRGGGGFSWQILQNNKFGFTSIHDLDVGIDKGDIIYQKKYNIENCNSPNEYNQRYKKNTVKLFSKFVNKFFSNKKFKRIKQNEDKSTYWPRLNTQIHGWINWDWHGKDIQKFLKAFDDPYPGAHTSVGNKIVYLKNSSFFKLEKFHPFQAGIIFRKRKGKLFVSVKGGYLVIGRILDKNKKNITKKLIKVGDRFFTPKEKLEKALKERVYFHLN